MTTTACELCHEDCYAVMGNPIAHSQSPRIHHLFARQTGQSLSYDALLVEPDSFDQAVAAFLIAGGKGLNVTVPFKQEAHQIADELSARAQRAAAVNTLLIRDEGALFGDNTDGVGLVRDLTRNLKLTLSGKQILLLGAGGAGTAISHALLTNYDCHLEIFDTDHARAGEVSEHLCEVYGPDRATIAMSITESVARCDGVINATPVGMKLHPGCPLDTRLLRPDLWVADIIYFPLDTELVTAATDAGCTVMKGGGMAVFQAVRAFERFTGVVPDVDRMKAHFDSLVNRKHPEVTRFKGISA